MAKPAFQKAVLRICLEDVAPDRFDGWIYSRWLRQPLRFRNLAGFLLQVDGLLDAQDFPRAYQRKRRFVTAPEGELAEPRKAESRRRGGAKKKQASTEGPAGMSAEEIGRAYGKAGTFELVVVSRRNTAWQGLLRWLGEPWQEFASTLELARLLQRRLFELPGRFRPAPGRRRRA